MTTSKAYAKLSDNTRKGIVYVYASFFRGGFSRVDIMWEDGYRQTYPLSFFSEFTYTM
jgi:hypothetical protein